MKQYPLGLALFITVIVAVLFIGGSRIPHISYQPTSSQPQAQEHITGAYAKKNELPLL